MVRRTPCHDNRWYIYSAITRETDSDVLRLAMRLDVDKGDVHESIFDRLNRRRALVHQTS